MMYLGSDKGWIRKDLVSTAVGDPAARPGAGGGAARRTGAGAGCGSECSALINNGIQGDARKSTVELGKRIFDTKVDYAVNQIHQLLGASKPAAQ